MKPNHVISTDQFLDTVILNEIFDVAARMENEGGGQSLAGKLLATVFYEPSTRTRLSFEAAMQRLGGGIISTENAGTFSSAIKGESLEDSIKVIAGYADAIVLRHPEKGSAQRAADASPVPLINAGDGAGEHPTQALLDMYTIKRELGKIDGLTVALVGDLLNGRTVHSLVRLLALYPGVKVHLVSPGELAMPGEYKKYLEEKGVSFTEQTDLAKVIGEVDVIYMTRIQKERFSSQAEYERLKGEYVLNESNVGRMQAHARILHPLPRVDEISPQVDSDERAAYFRQAKNGLYVRMALLQMILG